MSNDDMKSLAQRIATQLGTKAGDKAKEAVGGAVSSAVSKAAGGKGTLVDMQHDGKDWFCPDNSVYVGPPGIARNCAVVDTLHPPVWRYDGANWGWSCPNNTTPNNSQEWDKKCAVGYMGRVLTDKGWVCPAGTADTGKNWENAADWFDGHKQCKINKAYTSKVMHGGAMTCPGGSSYTGRSDKECRWFGPGLKPPTGNTPQPGPRPTPPPSAAPLLPTPAPTRGPTPVGMTVFQAGDPALKVSGKSAPVVTKAGKKAFEVTYPKGTRGGGGTNMNALIAPASFFPSEQCRFSFKWFVDPGFPWNPSTMKKSTGKILGFYIGSGDASGGNYSKTGATYRITWGFHGGVAAYVYPQVKKSDSSRDISWTALDQSPEFQKNAYIAMGVHVWHHQKDQRDPAAWDMKLKEGQWNDIEMYIKLNTPGKYDGIMELKVNGVMKRLSAVRFRYDNAKINGIKLHTFFGGSTLEYAPPRDVKSWYADFGFARS